MLLQHLLDENLESYSLDALIKKRWRDDYKEKFWLEYKNYSDAPENIRLEYAAKDVIYTSLLYEEFQEKLIEEDIPESLVSMVHTLQSILAKTEREGILVDLPYLKELGVQIQSKINLLQPKMRNLVRYELETIELDFWSKELQKMKTDKGRANVERPEFSFESSKQLQTLLYDHLGLPAQRNDKTQNISTDYTSLEKLKPYHPVIGLIQENRELQKVYNSFIVGTNDRIIEGSIYPEFRVNGTVTGRISHSNPNMAQLPKEGGIRGIYIPRQDFVFLSADYSQLEVILEANLTRDKNLIKMIENGESKHDLTARELGCDRHTAKTLNFALQYWASHFKVAKLLGVSETEAKSIWKKYWQIYSGPKKLKSETDSMVDSGTPIVNLLGRKRRFPLKKRSPWDSDYRQAYNFLIQGTGADITSKAFCHVSGYLQNLEYGRGLFTVHDELLIEVLETHWEHCEKILIRTMELTGFDLELNIPLKAESSGIMRRWED